MPIFTFTLVLEGPRLLDEPNMLDALNAAGCDDSLFGEQNGLPYADFDREAPSLDRAVLTAITDVESTVPELRVVRVETQDLVSAANIAALTSRSRESIRLLIEGKRGPGSFPAPAMQVGKSALWRWADVVAWFATYEPETVQGGDEVGFVAAINTALELRRSVRGLPADQSEAVERWVVNQLPSVSQRPHVAS